MVFQGRVQGVGFRARARSVATGHPVTGWVRNEPDGTVTLELQGEPGAVDGCLAELRRKVSGLVERELAFETTPVPDERGFVIARD